VLLCLGSLQGGHLLQQLLLALTRALEHCLLLAAMLRGALNSCLLRCGQLCCKGLLRSGQLLAQRLPA
jgi:hypothetical protein